VRFGVVLSVAAISRSNICFGVRKTILIGEKMTRYALRTDHNQKPIVEALRAAGAKVKVVHQPYDLQVWAYSESDRCMYMEVKNPNTAYGKKGLNSKQEDESRGLPVVMVDSVDAAMRALNVLRA
jgi:ornithine cyclodeaminase/alanine dehydrogenase-like protein (mu-crystallin family)